MDDVSSGDAADRFGKIRVLPGGQRKDRRWRRDEQCEASGPSSSVGDHEVRGWSESSSASSGKVRQCRRDVRCAAGGPSRLRRYGVRRVVRRVTKAEIGTSFDGGGTNGSLR